MPNWPRKNVNCASSGAISIWEDSLRGQQRPCRHRDMSHSGPVRYKDSSPSTRDPYSALVDFIPVPDLTGNRSIKLNRGVSLRDRQNGVVVLYRIFIPASGPRG